MDWQSARRLDCFTVIPGKIETVGFEFDAHRDSDAWTCGVGHVISLSSRCLVPLRCSAKTSAASAVVSNVSDETAEGKTEGLAEKLREEQKFNHYPLLAET